MENIFQDHINEWKKKNKEGRFAEARQFYFDQLFEEVIANFERQIVNKWHLEEPDVLFSILGFTPEPIILAERALRPNKHVVFYDKEVSFNEENFRFLKQFLNDENFIQVKFTDDSFGYIYEMMKLQMAFNAGRNYIINITGGKKSMVASASIFARDFNSTIIYIDYDEYDSDLRRPTPGTERMNIVYTPARDLPEIFHR